MAFFYFRRQLFVHCLPQLCYFLLVSSINNFNLFLDSTIELMYLAIPFLFKLMEIDFELFLKGPLFLLVSVVHLIEGILFPAFLFEEGLLAQILSLDIGSLLFEDQHLFEHTFEDQLELLRRVDPVRLYVSHGLFYCL